VRWKQVGDYLGYLVVRVFVCTVQAMRIETGRMLAVCLAWLFCEVLEVRKAVVEENLRLGLPELSEDLRRRLTRRMWEHLFLLVLEVAHAPRKIHETNWRSYIGLKHADRLVRQLLSDRPTLVVTAHFGNFEVAGYVLAILGFPTYTVARTLDNPYLDRFLNGFRGRTGQYIVPKSGGYQQIAKVLSSGGTMTLLADQNAGRKGCWVEFFGRPASAHKGVALLALENDAVVVICSARRYGKPLQIELWPTATADPRVAGDDLGTIAELTQWYTSRLEEFIRRAPEQYWWLHRRWRDTRHRRRSRKRRAA